MSQAGKETNRMAQDESYNGWANYPTWTVGMYLDGNYAETGDGRAMQGYVHALVSTTADRAERDENVGNGIWTVEQARRFRVADALKEWTRERVELSDPTLASDLLGWALDHVDWHELADSQLTTLAEERASV